MNDDIYTSSRYRDKNSEKNSSKRFNIILSVMILVFFGWLSVSFYQHTVEIEEAGKRVQLAHAQQRSHFKQNVTSRKKSVSHKKQKESKSFEFTNYSVQTRKTASRKENSNRVNTKTCLYWNKKYNEDHSNYSKLMQDDACKRAKIRVVTRPQSQKRVVQSSYSQKGQERRNSSKGASTQRCTYYKQKLEKIKTIMRRGYTASQYNGLESARKKWQNKLFDECKHHSINSY